MEKKVKFHISLQSHFPIFFPGKIPIFPIYIGKPRAYIGI